MDYFNELLLSYSRQEPEERKKTEKELWDRYGAEKTVLVIDMSGFSLLTERFGVVHYLSMVRRMQITSRPIVEDYKGKVIKFEADNCFAVFDHPQHAVQTAISLNHAFDAANVLTPDELDIKIAAGIAHGRVLLVADTDFYGGPVNRASKLGEDLARPGEILVSSEAMALIPEEASISYESVSFDISGISLNCASITR